MLRNIRYTYAVPALFLFAGALFFPYLRAGHVAQLTPGDAVSLVDTVVDEVSGGSRPRIFVMPGHEPKLGGAEFKRLRERDMNVVLAGRLVEFLRSSGKYDVVMGRDSDGWLPELASYFETEEDEIVRWKDGKKEAMEEVVEEGLLPPENDPAAHQPVEDDVAIRLYGINKWVGENDFDLIVHVHFNDYGSRKRNQPGTLSGFVIYVPDRQFLNASIAMEAAQSIRRRLAALIVESDAKKERGGVIEKRDLIATGSNDSAIVPSVLVEYGYVYEPQFQDGDVSAGVVREYAHQTYLGIEDFFFGDESSSGTTTADVLPHAWARSLSRGMSDDVDVLALQFSLLSEGLYPPKGKTLRDCPLAGTFGSCTASALSAFQKANGIDGDGSGAGEKTLSILNSLFGE